MLRTTQNRIPSRCFICGGDFSLSRFAALDVEGSRYEVLFCGRCGLGKTEPFLSEDELKRLYSSSYRKEDSTRFPAFLERLISVVRDGRRRSVERYAKKGRILDIGCGRGDFLLKMLGKGWECFGLDIDERVSRHNRPGMELKYGGLSSHIFPDSYFSAITFWHVFEHLRDPEWALGECARILKPGGLLVVAVPNIESLQSRLSGRGWFHLDPPFHLYHYSARNIRTLLEKSGFEVLAQKHFSFEYNPYGYIQSFYNRLGFSQNQLYEFLRSRSGKSAALIFTLATAPVVALFSVLLSGVESLFRAGGTVEVYARRKAG